MYSINQIWKRNLEHETPLLSNYSAEWWSEYLNDYEKYDKVFRRLYMSFYFFLQSRDETLTEVTENFTDEVKNILMVHEKEFAELYRVKVLAANAYKLTDNYDMQETLSKTGGETLGARQDSYSNSTGAQSNSATGKVSPYDSENFYNDNSMETSLGARQDGGTANTGAQTNSMTESYTLTRKGNIGVSTATDMIKKHVDFWTSFNFYHYVFSVIARELLTVNDGGGYDAD